MDRLTVCQQYDSKDTAIHLRDPSPPPNPAIRLDRLPEGRVDSTPYPVVGDHSPVWAPPYHVEVGRCSHPPTVGVPEPPVELTNYRINQGLQFVVA